MALSIGVMGAGAIGCYLGGKLAARGSDVMFVGRERVQRELRASGLELIEIARRAAPAPPALVSPEALRFETQPSALADRDVVLVCVKSAQSAEAGAALAEILPPSALVVSMQNGMRNADVLRQALPEHTVLGGIVGFNVVSQPGGKFRRATTGPLVIEHPTEIDDARIPELAQRLRDAGFETELAPDIRSVQWSKLVMNLNNAVSALTDAPTVRLLFEKPYRRIIAAIMAEALAVFARAGIRPARLGPIPVRLFPLVLGLPTPLFSAIARLQVEVDPEARSSMWEDLTRRRGTEVDQLNGEIVELAAAHGMRAPLNERIVELVHDAERRALGSPKLGADELWRALHV